MTSTTKIPGQELDKLTDALIEDLLATPDTDFLEEETVSGRDPKQAAPRVRDLIQKGCAMAAKSKLREAKAAVAENRARRSVTNQSIDASQARQLLKKLAANDPEFQNKLTLAARNEDELSDEDILSIVEDLRELGALPDRDDGL